LHKSWIVFVGTFFLGESVVLAASALAAQGSWTAAAVAGWAFAGTLASDTIWFRTARLGLDRWSDGERAERLARATARLDRLVGEHPHRALTFIKFVYGTRIASIAYMATRNVPTRRFIAFDAIGTCLWLAVMIPIGWAIGRGLDHLGADLKEVEWIVLGIVLAAAAVRGIQRWRTRIRE
jgi:membrane protein DedA with SNARE-associated domain